MTRPLHAAEYLSYLTCALQRAVVRYAPNLPSGFPNPLAALRLPEFLVNFNKHAQCSPSVLVCATVLLERYLEAAKPQVTLNSLTVRTLMVGASVLALKYTEDEHYSNSYYAAAGGMRLHELNSLEKRMFQTLQCTAYVSEMEYARYEAYAREHLSHCSVCRLGTSASGVPEFGYAEPSSCSTDSDLGTTDCTTPERNRCRPASPLSVPPRPTKARRLQSELL